MRRRGGGTIVLAAAAFLACGPAFAQSAADRAAAVEATLDRAAACSGLGGFYWEIGDANGRLASGSRGGVAADRRMRIASASKWVFGAYVAERRNGALTDADVAALEMTSGYTGLNPVACAVSRTVAGCFERRHNDAFDPKAVGKFSYNGGHDQKLAIDLGLGPLDSTGFAAEIRRVLGVDIGFSSPQPAGGMETSAAAYAVFLRKILRGELRISGLLGSRPVCTLPSACAQAAHSPSPQAWHYSLNHWVEDAPGGDGAFSSPGAFGFYPWIAADRATYGILARESITRRAWVDSAACGAAIRRAWTTGKALP